MSASVSNEGAGACIFIVSRMSHAKQSNRWFGVARLLPVRALASAQARKDFHYTVGIVN